MRFTQVSRGSELICVNRKLMLHDARKARVERSPGTNAGGYVVSLAKNRGTDGRA